MLLSRRLWRLYRFYNRLVYLDIFIRVSIKFIGTKIRIYSNKKNSHSRGCLSVGVTGFEPATLCSQSRCATGLRYAPKMSFKIGGGERGIRTPGTVSRTSV